MNEENLQGRVCQNDGKLPSTTICSALDLLDKHDLHYLLGYTYTDGSIIKRNNTYRVNWSSIDLELIEWIKDLLGKNAKSIIRKDKMNCYRYDLYGVDIASEFMSRGIVPNKTYMNIFPTIDKLYLKDFFRGFFDGDGNVCKINISNKSYGLQITIVNKLKENLQSLGNLLREELDIIPKITPKLEASFRLCYSTYEVMRLFYWMYDSPSFYLKRKKNVFLKFLEDRKDLNFGRRTCEICKNIYSVTHDKSHICWKCKKEIKMKA